jgi:protein arginine N-methyltransferase 7
MSKQVQVVHALSTDVDLDDANSDSHQKKATVLVSEIIGTLLLGESQLEYMEDARRRLLVPDATILPAAGIQCAA